MKKILKLKYFMLGGIPLWLTSLNCYAQEDAKKPTVEFHGFVNYEMIYDTRQNVSAREGEVLLYPKPIERDSLGNDINSLPSFHMFTFHTRLKAQLNGPEVSGFKTSGLIEFDFLGNHNNAMNLIRLRHAFMKLSNSKLDIIMGQYWHPMFVPECFPEVATWGAAVPVHPLSRNPQLRVTYKLNSSLSLSGSVLTQRDFSSAGPGGSHSGYMKNAGIPEFNGQIIIGSGKALQGGFTGGYKVIAPRIVTDVNISNKETLASTHWNAFLKVKTEKVVVKLQGIYGQNMSNLLLLGGYAVKEISDTLLDKREYTNISSLSVWGEVIANLKPVQLAIFGGYSANLGSKETLLYPELIYGLGNDIDYLFRIAPRITYSINNLKFIMELYSTGVAYKNTQPESLASDNPTVINHRFIFSSFFNF